jgi:glycosyltransferase involved in cell wall biosynthesis
VKAIVKSIARSAERLLSNFRAADISMFHDFVPPPYGGGNQFLWGLRRELERRQWRVETNTVSPVTRACVFNSFNFDFDRLRMMKRDGCRMVHRVDGPIAAYRGVDEGLDQRIWQLNHELADATVFQSEYSRGKHDEMGLTFRSPRVIPNAADPAIFNAEGRAPFLTGPRARLIASSWSNNPNKGADVYAWLDEHLDFSRYEFTFLGRSAAPFKNIRLVPPVASEGVAAELRTHDVFVIASRNEPCSNALVEALSCGLPVVYLDSGSHGEIVGAAGLPFRNAAEVPGLLDRIVREHAAFAARVSAPRLADVADQYLTVMGLPATPASA